MQDRVLDLVEQSLETTVVRETCPGWLLRPGRSECRDVWSTIQVVYQDLTGRELPEVMPSRERRSIDAVLVGSDGLSRIVEVDEVQHFTPARARTLALYPPKTRTAYERAVWQSRSVAASKLRGGGWGRPCPPLFSNEGGRHSQRAFRDALADLLPGQYGWAPTLRIGDFEVLGWLHSDDAVPRMKAMLSAKGVAVANTATDGSANRPNINSDEQVEKGFPDIVGNRAVEDAAIAFVVEYEHRHGRRAHDTRGRGAAADVESDDRIIEVKAAGRSARGFDLWLEVRQVEEARTNPTFHVYVVDNIRQGDPGQFRLIDLHGDPLQTLLERAKEQHYFAVPFPVAVYDRLLREGDET